MKRLNIFCEGATEQYFCTQVLQPHLFPQGDGLIHTLPVGEKDHRHIYGIGRFSKYETIRKFIRNTIRQLSGQSVYFTTLFDLYALPDDFPGMNANVLNPSNPVVYVQALERAFEDDIGRTLGNAFDKRQFLPHLQLHEFEAMLFADPEAFAYSFEDRSDQINRLKEIAAEFPTPEHINNDRNTAPSKRIIQVIPEYEGLKSTAGPDIAAYIGLSTIRARCPHVDQWLKQLESLE